MAFAKILLAGDATTEVEAEATLVLAGDVTIVGSGKSLEVVNLKAETATELTIGAGGDITRTQIYHNVDTNSDDASDDLVGIIGGADGMMVILRPNNDARTVVVKHNGSAAATDNILLSNDTDFTMDDEHDVIFLIYEVSLDTNGAWIEISRGSGGVAALTAVAPSSVDTTANIAVGTGTAAAKEDHVHDIANLAIDSPDLFVDGSVDAGVIAANAVGNSEINNTATDIAFLQIILTPTASGTGTTVGTLFFDSSDNHPYVFV